MLNYEISICKYPPTDNSSSFKGLAVSRVLAVSTVSKKILAKKNFGQKKILKKNKK